jgi:hypothetical protein
MIASCSVTRQFGSEAVSQASENATVGQWGAMTTPQWEYRVETIKNPDVGSLQDRLNKLGADGWELVAVTSTVKTMVNLTGNDLVLTFKRPGVGEWSVATSDGSAARVPWA